MIRRLIDWFKTKVLRKPAPKKDVTDMIRQHPDYRKGR